MREKRPFTVVKTAADVPTKKNVSKGTIVKFHSKTERKICMFPGSSISTVRKTWRGLPVKRGLCCG